MSNLRKYRESLNISQTTLAKAVGCTQGAIGHWESGRRFPDLKTCRALVACLNKLGAKVSLDDVFPPEHKSRLISGSALCNNGHSSYVAEKRVPRYLTN